MADKAAGDKVRVRFVKNSLPYAVGDESWFNEIQAASFIKQGYAVRAGGAAYVPAPTRAQVMAEEAARHRAAVAAAA